VEAGTLVDIDASLANLASVGLGLVFLTSGSSIIETNKAQAAITGNTSAYGAFPAATA